MRTAETTQTAATALRPPARKRKRLPVGAAIIAIVALSLGSWWLLWTAAASLLWALL
jgi:hypothetical protein